MPSTFFVDRATSISAAWLNDINTSVYTTAVNVKSLGVVGDGSTDDTAKLQAALNSNLAILIPPGTYKCTSNLTCIANQTIVGAGGLIRFTSGCFQAASGTTFRTLSIDGNNKTNASHGINLPAGANNVIVDTCTFTNIHYNAINNAAGATNLKVIYPNINNIGGGGISTGSQGMGIYSSGFDGVFVYGGEIQQTYGQGGCFFNTGSNYMVDGVYIHDTYFRGVSTFNSPNNGFIVNNKIRRTGQINTSGSGVGCNGIFVVHTDASQTLIYNNDIADTAENGIEGSATIANNRIRNTGYLNLTTPSKEGIFPGIDAKVIGNSIYSSFNEGIKRFSNASGTNLELKNNSIYSPGSTGITVQVDGAGITFGNLVIEGNTVYGANSPGSNGLNIFGSNGGAFTQATSTVKNNIVYGRTTNVIGNSLGYVLSNSFDPTFNSVSGNQTAPKSDDLVLFYASPLVATTTVTLNATNPILGDVLKVVRATTSTGAFTLNVGALKGLSAAGQWATVEYDGSAWQLIATGSL